MKCPSCHAQLPAPAPQCPKCHVTLRRLDLKFGAVPRHSRMVTDRSETLSLRAIKEMRAMLALFGRKFPQSLFSVLVVGQVENGTIAEYAFWLANRARFSSVEAIGGENFDILLALDLKTRSAALQIGYGLENYLSEQDLTLALARGSSAFHAGDFVRGVRECVESMTDRMREAAKKTEQNRSPRQDDGIDY